MVEPKEHGIAKHLVLMRLSFENKDWSSESYTLHNPHESSTSEVLYKHSRSIHTQQYVL